MDAAEVLPDDPLRAWDWLAELIRQERGIPWLARQTGTHYKAVYRYKWGVQTPPLDWLKAAATVLKVSPE